MKYILVLLLLVSLLFISCAHRWNGETYPGYSCRESLMHFYSQCYDGKLTKEEFEGKVKFCEKELKTGICVKEQADLLWCQGRVLPGTYSSGGGVGVAVGKGVALSGGQSNTMEGCDCSIYTGAIKECRMKKGIFE
jgi:hypothetical protein